METLQRIDRRLARIEELVLFALLLGLLGLAVLQVLWRNVIQPYGHRPPLMWIDEILKHGTLALGLLGASLATHADRHIRLDLLARFASRSRRLEHGLGLVVRSATLAISVLVARAGLAQVYFKEEALEAVLQPWQWQITIPIAFALIAIHLVTRIVLDIAALIRGPS